MNKKKLIPKGQLYLNQDKSITRKHSSVSFLLLGMRLKSRKHRVVVMFDSQSEDFLLTEIIGRDALLTRKKLNGYIVFNSI
ncbi:MAG: hypothetical protein GX198_07635 [Epulopiscium sp.]|nr:hypothetical protein [Candidatus Epulonipiscium sp.]